MANANRYVGRVIYDLKRQYGVAIRICGRTSEVTDVETGLKTVSYSGIEIYKAIKMPSVDAQLADYAEQIGRWSRGQFFGVGDAAFLVAQADLPLGYVIDESNYLIFENRRYDVVTAQLVNELQAWALTSREVKNGLTYQLARKLGVILSTPTVEASAYVV